MFLIPFLRALLLPVSILYGVVISIRNLGYDYGIFKSTSFDIPIITVGNLSVGGTGKTPQIEYLVHLLQQKYTIAILSRGYKRKSKGFVLANQNSTVLDLGDEPFQYHQKFKNVQVAVHGNRVEGVENILTTKPNTELVLLDDAYQHRKIKAGFQVLLSSYDQLFCDDFMMPTGNLRELWWGKKRADVIVVTKCPLNITKQEQHKIRNRIKPVTNQQVYFTGIRYAKNVKGFSEQLLVEFVKQKIVLVTGIAKPKPLVDYLNSLGANFEHLEFADHHHFLDVEIKRLKNISKTQKILTTEKDYVRLENELPELYYLPIEIQFLNKKEEFDERIVSFVSQF